MTKSVLPAEITDLINTEVVVQGHIFDDVKVYKKETTFTCMDVKLSVSRIRTRGVYGYRRAYELLLKNKKMKEPEWSMPFPFGDYITKEGY